MDWDATLVLTRSILVQPVGFDAYAAKASFSSREALALDGVTLGLLSAFVQPCTPRQARDVFATRWNVSQEDYERTLEQLLSHGLVAEVGAAKPIQTSDYASVLTHHPMLTDTLRLDAYRTAIERHVAGRRVVEIGCGTGILSMFAAQAGAAKVTAIEETGVIALAAQLIHANGLADQIELVAGNSLDASLEQPAEVLIHELIGHEPLAENAVRFLADAKRRLLVEGGRMIPDIIEVWCRAVTRASWLDPGRRVAEAHELERRYGLELAPYCDKLAQVPRLPTFSAQLDAAPTGALTSDAMLQRVDFSAAEPVDLSASSEVELEVLRGGCLTSVALWFRARMDERLWLSNAPDAPRTHWALAIYELAQPRRVAAGDRVEIRAHVETFDGLERTMLELVD